MPENYKLDGKYCIKLRDADNPGNINFKNVNIYFLISKFFWFSLIFQYVY